jgi:type VI secretion system protein ImpE
VKGAAAAEEALRNGDPAGALELLQSEVRNRPEDSALRVFLFQLLCVVGQWERALNQLKVAADMDAAALPMAQMYGAAVRCEAVRSAVFAGQKSPMIFGEPDQWLALLIESLLAMGQGDTERSEELRLRAFDEAPTSTGDIDGRRFEWIADADSRLGPVLEAMINGRYYWVPFARLSRVDIEAPVDLRDTVWMPAHLQFANGGESLALVPTRYPGSERSDDGLIALARRTIWESAGPDAHHGLGQRLIATDAEETPLMDIRAITIDATAEGGDDAAEPDATAEQDG